jgi:hypothetical protein
MPKKLRREIVAAPREAFEPNVPRGEFHLLSIGIDRYRHFDPLETAANGARAIVRVLTEHYYGFDARHVVTLVDEQATHEAITNALDDLDDQMAKDDSLLIFYAGHGHKDRQNRGYWIPVDGLPKKKGTWINNALLRDMLVHYPARHVLLVSDSCFSGTLLREAVNGVEEITDAYTRRAFACKSRQVLTSGSDEPVRDGGAEGHSVFTWFLLSELLENPHPYLVPLDLFYRIKGAVAANAPQKPRLGVWYEAGGEEDGEFVLFRAGRTKNLGDRNGDQVPGALEAALDKLEELQHQELRVALDELERLQRAAEQG